MRKLIVTLLVLYASAVSSDPLLYTFGGYITILNKDDAGIAAEANLSVGSYVTHTFLVDFDETATRTYVDGTVEVFEDNYYVYESGNPGGVDSFYTDYISGSALREKDGGFYNSDGSVAEYNSGRNYLNYNDSGTDRGSLMGLSEDDYVQIGSDSLSVSNWVLGTEQTVYDRAHDSAGNVSLYVANVTLTGITDPPPTVSVVFPGGDIQECARTGDTDIAVSAEFEVFNDEDDIDTISWSVDGSPVPGVSGESVVLPVPLGTHSVEATLTTVLGEVSTASADITVEDTVPPEIDAAFVDTRTGDVITSISNSDKAEISVIVDDVCDPSPVTQISAGVPALNGETVRASTSGNSGKVNVSIQGSAENVMLMVTAEDASGNISTSSTVLLVD